MNPANLETLMHRAAETASTRPAFLGWVLARYQEIEGIASDALQIKLRASEAAWPRLQVCLRPRAESFLTDLTQIAEEFGLDRTLLASIIRRVDAVLMVQGCKHHQEAGTLLAARSRKKVEKPPKTKGSKNDATES